MKKPETLSEQPSQRPLPDPRNALQQSVLRKLRIIFSSAKKHFRAVEAIAGVSGAQLWALIEIRDHPGSTVSAIAERLSIHMSTASNLLEKLESRDLVIRTRSAKDQRSVQIRLTAKGRRILARAPGPARGVIPDALTRLPVTKLRALEGDLEALISTMASRDRRGSVTPISEL